MAERGEKFWHHRQLQLSTFEGRWYRENVCEDSLDYSMSGALATVGNHLVLLGPLLDGYLKQIGNAMSKKLAKNKATGLAIPINIYIPWQIAQHLIALCTGYGAEHYVINNKNTKAEEKIVVWITKEESAKKIFNPKRFDGSYFLTKRKFVKVPVKTIDGSMKLDTNYNGMAKVVITNGTPIKFDYNFSKEVMTVNFFIQRYNADGIAVDASVQELMNIDISGEEAKKKIESEI